MSQIGTASRRRLTMFASAASFGIAALVASNTFVPTFSQAKAAEADLLFADMENDAVDQLVRRLGVVRSLHPTPAEAVPAVVPRAPLPPPPL